MSLIIIDSLRSPFQYMTMEPRLEIALDGSIRKIYQHENTLFMHSRDCLNCFQVKQTSTILNILDCPQSPGLKDTIRAELQVWSRRMAS